MVPPEHTGLKNMLTTELGQTSLKAHPFAELFPLLGDEELRALADDIHEHGQRHDVVVDEDGENLDGRNRAAACGLLGILPRTTVFTGTDEEKMAFVMSANMQPRHMTESQRAMLAADVATITQGGNQHRKEDAHTGASSAVQAVVTQAQAATMFGVSRRSVQRARVVRDRGGWDIVSEVRAGRMTVNRAEAMIAERGPEPRYMSTCRPHTSRYGSRT